MTICDGDNFPWSASWGSNDQIFIAHPTGDIQRVSADGGKPESVVVAKPGEILDAPQLLPGGDALLFTLASASKFGNGRWDKAQIVVQSLKSGERKILIEGGSDARYLPTGHIVYALGSTLFAIPFDVKKLRRLGSPISVLEGVMRSSDGASATADFSVSDSGSLVYVPGELAPSEARVLSLVDRAGVRKPLNIPAGNYAQPRVSPDGKQLVLYVDDGNERFVAIYDLAGSGPLRRLTFGGHNERPLWTHDGKRVVFASDRDGDAALFWQPADGGPAELLTKVAPGILPQPEAWTPDGKVIIFSNRIGIGARGGGIATFSLTSGEKPKLLIKPPAGNPSLSPDGRWLAYASNESSDRNNVYVEPYPPTGAKYQISTSGGGSPLWSPDGKQLYYVAQGQIMAVDVQQTQPNFVPGKTTPLRIEGVTGGPRPYDLLPDGKLVVLMPQSQAESGRAPLDQINITLNWFEELKLRVPAR